ncbi:MAG: hypothetical protein ABIK68_01830 [bacterium]
MGSPGKINSLPYEPNIGYEATLDFEQLLFSAKRLRPTNVYTGLHIAAAGLELGDLCKFIVNQPSAWQPVKLALAMNKQYSS